MVLFHLSDMAMYWIRYSRFTIDENDIEKVTTSMTTCPWKISFVEVNT